MFKGLFFLVGILLQIQCIMGQAPGLVLPGVQSVEEGVEFELCFGVNAAPVGGDLVVNIMANPDAIPRNIFGDYASSLTFPDGDQMSQCIMFIIPVDNVAEDFILNEVLVVTTTFQGVTSDPVVVVQLLVEDTTVLTIGFVEPSYTFIENTTENLVCVNVDGTIIDELLVSAMISYIPDSATAAVDYSEGLDMVTFSQNTTNQMECVVISIADDGGFEGLETLTVQLSSPDESLVIDPGRSTSIINILDIEADCGPPPAGDGVTPAPSNPPYGIDASGILVANPGAVANYTCADQDNVENFMGPAQLTCTIVNESVVQWEPITPPSCLAPEMTTTELDMEDDTTELSMTEGSTDGASSTHSSVIMLLSCVVLCLGQFAVDLMII